MVQLLIKGRKTKIKPLMFEALPGSGWSSYQVPVESFGKLNIFKKDTSLLIKLDYVCTKL